MFAYAYGLTNIGQMRELNEDAFRICGFENGKPLGVCVLADGMGGHNAGEIASQTAVQIISDGLASDFDEEDKDALAQSMAATLDMANSEIYNMSLHNREQAGMGTTTVLAFVKEDFVRIANIGDSRAYLITDKKIRKITTDHSVVEELVKSGSITREEARNHPDKNIITRAVGTEKFVDADFYDYKASPEDVILLCSDGLYEMLDEIEIKRIVNNSESLCDAVNKLVDAANKNGGYDNITVVALRFEEEEMI